jgi:hypothetical protein
MQENKLQFVVNFSLTSIVMKISKQGQIQEFLKRGVHHYYFFPKKWAPLDIIILKGVTWLPSNLAIFALI